MAFIAAKKKEIDAVCLSPKTFASREAFNEALLAKLQSYNVDLVVLAGCLVVIPQSIVADHIWRISCGTDGFHRCVYIFRINSQYHTDTHVKVLYIICSSILPFFAIRSKIGGTV